jgi:LysM repeat protein
MEINGIADPDKIIEGNKLIIPSAKISNARNTNKVVYKKYKVKSGDSLSVIAKKYKVTV